MFQNEKIIETKACKHCSASFEITDKDLEFYEKVSPIFPSPQPSPSEEREKKRFLIPTPTLCPDCRQQRRLSFRNRRNIYKRKCDATGKDIISMYSPDKLLSVYHTEDWYSQKYHNPLDFGIDYDFNKSFFSQFYLLYKKVPFPHAGKAGVNENSEYCNGCADMKNCYMCFNAFVLENCYFSDAINYCNNTINSLNVDYCENISDSVDTRNSYNSNYLINCVDCRNSNFLKNCIGCSNCFGCINLVNKKYYIFNKEYSKEDYNKLINDINLGNYQEYNKYLKKFLDFSIKFPNKCVNAINIQNSTGDYLYNVNNCLRCFDSADSEDCKFSIYAVNNTKDCYDLSYFGVNLSQCLDVVSSGINGSNLLFSDNCFENVNNLYYCSYCVNGTNNCFGCVGLNNKQYCILNKQYTKEEYEEIVPKIIEHMQKTGEWGEFFPSSISPFGYNETVAQEYYTLDRKDTINRVSTDLNQIFNWSTYEAPFPKVDKIIPAKLLPDDIKDIPDDILNRAIMPDDECDENDVGTGFKPVPTEKQIKKPFRIIPQELEFYRKHNLPIPRKHPDQRHLDRMALRNPRKLFDRKCDKCGKDMKTTYAPEREEIVYCEKCYESEIY